MLKNVSKKPVIISWKTWLAAKTS